MTTCAALGLSYVLFVSHFLRIGAGIIIQLSYQQITKKIGRFETRSCYLGAYENASTEKASTNVQRRTVQARKNEVRLSWGRKCK